MTDTSGLRDRLIETGIDVLERDGVAGVGLRAVTRKAGVSHGAPRRYFPTHRDLLAAIAKAGFDDLNRRFEPVLRGESSAAQQLSHLGLAFVRFALDRPAMFELMFRHDLIDGGEIDGVPLRHTTLPLFATLTDLVRAAVPEADSTEMRTLALWTNVHGIAVLAANGSIDLVAGPVDVPVLIERAVGAHLQY